MWATILSFVSKNSFKKIASIVAIVSFVVGVFWFGCSYGESKVTVEWQKQMIEQQIAQNKQQTEIIERYNAQKAISDDLEKKYLDAKQEREVVYVTIEKKVKEYVEKESSSPSAECFDDDWVQLYNESNGM